VKRDKHDIKSHGGKRAGAGRPKDPESIRSKFAAAVASDKTGKPWKHSYTLYEIRLGTFISNHAHILVLLLHMAPDKSTRARNTRGEHQTLLTLNAAANIAKHDKDRQIEILKVMGVLRKFVEQYKDDDDKLFGDRARQLLGIESH